MIQILKLKNLSMKHSLKPNKLKGTLKKNWRKPFFYRCQKCYSFHIKTDFLPDGEKEKTEKLREQKSLRYEEVQQEYESLKKKN